MGRQVNLAHNSTRGRVHRSTSKASTENLAFQDPVQSLFDRIYRMNRILFLSVSGKCCSSCQQCFLFSMGRVVNQDSPILPFNLKTNKLPAAAPMICSRVISSAISSKSVQHPLGVKYTVPGTHWCLVPSILNKWNVILQILKQ